MSASADALDSAILLNQRIATERLLAGARLAATVVLLAALASGAGPLHPPAVGRLVTVYSLYAAGLVALAWLRPNWPVRAAQVLHVADLAWATWATTVSGGASSHAFPLFAFALVASACRWGLRRTLFDAALVVVIAAVESLPALAGATSWAFELDWFLVWVCYIALAVGVGVLHERQHVFGPAGLASGRVTAGLGQASGLASAIHQALGEVMHLFGAGRVRLIVEECDTGRLFSWRADRQPDGTMVLSHAELPREERAHWFFPVPRQVAAYEARQPGRDQRGEQVVSLAIDRDGRAVDPSFELSAAAVRPEECESVLAVIVDWSEGWRGRLFLLDPSRGPGGELRLRSLQSLARHVSPAVLNFCELRRLRSKAESRERARVSRELHDGVIQSLLGLEIGLEMVRRRADGIAPHLALDLAQIRDRLHEEALNVRELMQALRPLEVDGARLSYELADMVERFSRSSGIDGRLEWAVDVLDLPPSQCRDLTRIVQEALVNVRRHSGASRVTVRLEADASVWALIVEDNGRGLGFTGRMNGAQLAAELKGPRLVRERVTDLGGSIIAESSPSGTRLEMTFPRAVSS